MELGRLLNEVVYGGDYKEWGYDDFAVYCARELGLKKPTVQKLMISYNYMKKFEHERLDQVESGGDGPSVPDYQTVELLDRVRRRDDVDGEEAERLHRRAFEDAGDGEEESGLRKALLLKLKPSAPADPDKAEKAAVLGAARKLRKAMSVSHFVPDGLKERIEEPLVELEALD